MSSAVLILLITVSILQLGMGISFNTCLLVFSFKNLKNGLSVNPTNLIYSVKGLVNVFLQLVLTVDVVTSVLWPNVLFIRELHLMMTFLMLSPVYFSYWLTGWLCAHYCVSISNFTHKLLVGFKRFLSSSLLRVLLVSMMVSLVMSVLSVWELHSLSQEPPSTNNTQYAPSICVVYLMPKSCRLMATLLGCCLPFTLALISTGVTTSSLVRHMKKMKQNFSGNNGPNLHVLIRATRTMTLFLTLCVISYITGLLFLSSTSSYDTRAISLLSIMIFPFIEAAIIVQAIPKLRKMIVEKVCVGRQWSKETENCA